MLNASEVKNPYDARFTVATSQMIGDTKVVIMTALRDGRFKHYGSPQYNRGDIVLFVDGENAPRILTPKVPVPA